MNTQDEQQKVGGYTKTEWIEMIRNKVVAGISDEVFNFIRPDISDEEILLARQKSMPPLPPNAIPVTPEQAIPKAPPMPPAPPTAESIPAPPVVTQTMNATPLPPPPPVVAVMTAIPKELEIFSLEQLNVLPEEARTSIVNLGENLPSKELLILNPLVSKLLKIKELTKLEYFALADGATKEEIQAYKENIEKFKSAKKEIVELKTQTSSAKSAIKGPLDLLGKQVLTIEKSFKSIAEDVLAEIEKTFKPYLDAEAEKAKVAKEKKEAKEKEAINALSEQNAEQANQFKKSQLITFLKYEMLEPFKTTVNDAIQNYSLAKIYQVRDSLSLRIFKVDAVNAGKDLSLFTEDEISAMDLNYRKEVEVLRTNLNTKIQALELEKSNENMQNALEEVQAMPLPPVPPVPSAPTFVNSIGSIPPPMSVPTAPIVEAVIPEAQKIDAFAVSNQGTSTPYGAGANSKPVPLQLYPDNSKAVDYLDLVIGEIEKTRENISYITHRFLDDKEIIKSDEDVKNVTKVQASDELLNKVILYILGQLPPKQ
jgi:hypothetical protein